MKMKKIWAAVFICAFFIGTIAINAAAGQSGRCGESVTWQLDGNGTLTLSGTGATWDFRNDASYFDYHGEAPWQDYRDSIKSIQISAGITEIGASAFDFCNNLKSVTIPDTVQVIGPFSFYATGLESINLPEGITYLGQEAFANTQLKSVVIPGSVTFLDDAFMCCRELSYVRIKKDTSVGYTYGGYLFSMCTKLKNIIVDPGHSVFSSNNGVLYNGDTLVSYPPGKETQDFTIRDGCVTIYQGAFYGAENLRSVTLPVTLSSVMVSGFWDCPNLNSVTVMNDECSFNSDAFDPPECYDSLTFYGAGKSEAHAYADKKGFPFVSIEDAHDWEKWETTKEPTVFKSGLKERVCRTCGKREEKELAQIVPKLTLGTKSIKLEKTKTITFDAVFARGDSVTATSSNKKMVTVKCKGSKITITAKKKSGTAYVTVKTKTGKSSKVKITVLKAKTKKIQCKPVSVKNGNSVKLKPVVTPSYSDDKVTYSVKNDKIATVSPKGVVKGLKKGTTTITVKSGKKSVKVKVTVK